MGRTVSLPTSFKTTIGMLVTGSIINPRIFISTSISCSPLLKSLRLYHHAQQTVGKTPGNDHVNIAANGRHETLRSGKVQGYVLGGSTNKLSAGRVGTFNHYFIDSS